MKTIHTITVNGQTFVIQDPNAVSQQMLDQTIDETKAEIISQVEDTILGGAW